MKWLEPCVTNYQVKIIPSILLYMGKQMKCFGFFLLKKILTSNIIKKLEFKINYLLLNWNELTLSEAPLVVVVGGVGKVNDFFCLTFRISRSWKFSQTSRSSTLNFSSCSIDLTNCAWISVKCLIYSMQEDKKSKYISNYLNINKISFLQVTALKH